MKKGIVGYLISAAFVIAVVYVAFKISYTRNLILGTSPSV